MRTSKFPPKNNDPPKLVLPQDRYANATTQVTENDGHSSKFDRYDNSNSESEDEDEISDSKLERCDSLEALMEELDAEILGEPVKDRKSKGKKESTIEENIKNEEIKTKEISDAQEKDIEVILNNDKDSPKKSKPAEEKPGANIKEEEMKFENQKPYVKVQTERSPIQRKLHHRRNNNGRVFKSHQPMNNPTMLPNQPFMNHVQIPQFTTVYNTVPSYSVPEAYPINIPPPFIPPPSMPPHILPPSGFSVPPLQPLVIEPQSSVHMGPLSPRSAAFVLQNRAIVEKRKRSPRRSFSRSPSPPHHRPRYSNSPVSGRLLSPIRRSLSPVRKPFSPLQRSSSPRHSPARRSLSPYRRNREKSPRRDSPRRSPRRARISPRRSPKRGRDSPKKIKEFRRTPIKDRLGNKSKIDEKEPEVEKEAKSPPKKLDSKKLDPVLEARKKKFESNEINIKERVIRLKPKEESAPKEKEAKKSKPKEDSPKSKIEEKVEKTQAKPLVEKIKEKSPALLEPKEEKSTRIVLLPKNETISSVRTKSLVKPQDQLEDAINELEMLLKDDEALELTAKVDDLFTDEETDEVDSKKNKASKDVQNVSKSKTEKKKESKTKWKFDEPRKEVKKIKKEPLTNPIENRKIEIKIRNPSKYEKVKGTQGLLQSSRERTVELTKRDSFSDDDSEPEIVMEEAEIEEIATSREGEYVFIFVI